MARAERIATWMRRQLSSAGARGFVVGLSGGVDSAVVARLAQLAAPGAVLGLIMPSHSNPRDEQDALLLASRFALLTARIDLSAANDALATALRDAIELLPRDLRVSALGRERPTPDGIEPRGLNGLAQDSAAGSGAAANIKPRLRMTSLYFFARSLNYLVAGTGNKSELSIGYFTKYGDGGVDLLPLGHLVKQQVVALARDLNIPPEIIDRKPSAGLWEGQEDEKEIGFTYTELERYLNEGPGGVAPALAMRIERMVRASEHKRHLPPMPDAD